MSEELFYDRTRNISGVSLIDISEYTPSYGTSVMFASENSKFNINDNYYQLVPKGINNVKAKFDLVYNVDEKGARKLAHYYENTEGINLTTINTNPSIYKQTSGYCTDYSITHINNQRYEFKAVLEVIEESCVLNWANSSFLSYDVQNWEWNKDYKKNDIVYIEEHDLKINNFYYCKENHKSSADNSPVGQNTAWTQDFFWEPDLNTQTQVKIDTERFDTPGFTTFSKTRRHTATFPVSYSFSNISDKQLIAMIHFLQNKCGYRRFKHQIPSVYNRPKVYVCPTWAHTFVYDNNNTLRVSFEEDPLGIIPRKSTFDSDVDLSIETVAYDQNGDVHTLENGNVNPLEGPIEDNYFLNESGIHSIKLGQSSNRVGFRSFADCFNLSGELKIPNSITEIREEAFAGVSNQDNHCNFTGSLDIPDSVTNVGHRAFRGVPFNGSLSLSKNLEWFGNSCFKDCNFTGSIKIPTGVTYIPGDGFRNCSGFNGGLDLNKGLKNIYNNAFNGCSSLTGDLIIPNTTTFIGDRSFANCGGFGFLDLGSGVERLGFETFINCTGFGGDLILPDSLTGLGVRSFIDCQGFDGELVLGNFLQTIPSTCFARCRFTGELKLPDSIVNLNTRCFWDCDQFSSISLNFGLNKIGQEAFWLCSGVTGDLIIPDTVETILYRSFGEMSNLRGFYINKDASVFQGWEAFKNVNPNLEIYVTNTHISSYDPAWRTAQLVPAGVTINTWVQ